MRTDARLIGQVLLMVLAGVLAAGLTGCSGATRIDGRVVPGPVGLAVVVDPGDERLLADGVPGVEVALLRDSATNAGGATIMTAVSDETGSFRFTLRRGQHPAGPVIVRTRGAAVYTSRSRAYLPRAGQKLLCTVMLQPESERDRTGPGDEQ
jgi:hypothetical protein